MIDFASAGLIVTVPAFLAAAVVVWLAGVRITGYANVISEKSGMEQALIGMLLLGGVTSLPELAVALTASISGDAALAVNSVLGGIAMQIAILAIADIVIGRSALTSVLPDPVVFLQGGLKILLLSIAAAAIVAGDIAVFGVGLWMWLLLACTIVSMWVLSTSQQRRPWLANIDVADPHEGEQKRLANEHASEVDKQTLGGAIWRAAAAGTVIVIAGYILSRTGEALAEQTGLGQSFVGAVLVAISTSLPEMSTVYTAMRAGLYTMAVSDIFGTNIFDVSFLSLIDMFNGNGAVMTEVGNFSAFAAIIGITVTALMLVGLAERRDRTIFRMGYDTAMVLVTYLGGLVVLFFLRQ